MNRHLCRSRAAIVALTAIVALLPLGVVGAAPSAGCRASVGDVVVYRPPVASAIIDGFRLENGRYGAGNRGLEYRPGRSFPVAAMADGQVVFAGSVAGQLHITVCHADGRRSSYSYLQSMVVGVGDSVVAGSTVGLAGDRLHVGIREGRDYVDPESLLARGELRVHLVADASFGRVDDPTMHSSDRANADDVEPGLAIDPLLLRVALRSTVGLGRAIR